MTVLTKWVECDECFGTGEVVSGGVRYGGECDRCGGAGGYEVEVEKPPRDDAGETEDGLHDLSLTALLKQMREDALLEAEKAIVARIASYPRDQRAGIASTHMAALTVRRIRTGETATVYAGFEVVPSELLDAFKGATASLAAAISLLERGGKKAAPSDTMFEQMLTDYRNALARVRVAMVYKEKA